MSTQESKKTKNFRFSAGFIPISINGLVNSQSGLPSAAGTNEVVQEYDLEITERGLVY